MLFAMHKMQDQIKSHQITDSCNSV